MAETIPPQHAGLRFIALIKLAKAALLIAVGLGSLRLLNHDLSEVARSWARHLNIDPENHAAHWVIAWSASVQPDKIRHFGYFVLLFALDQIVEGVGLWYNQPWAKYLLLVATSIGFIWEGLQTLRNPSLIHYLGVGFATAILLYLWWMFRADKSRQGDSPR
jgi:uncharacterized membrane protein (DUF2068 family)